MIGRNSVLFVFLSLALYGLAEAQTDPPSPDSSRQAIQAIPSDSPLSNLKIYANVFAGVSMPVGRLKNDAKTGYVGGVQFYTNGKAGLLVSLSYSNNPSVRSESWGSFFLLSGLKIRLAEKNGSEIFLGFPCLGGFFSNHPGYDISLTSSGGMATGAILFIGFQKNIMMQARVVAGMLRGYAAPGYTMWSGYSYKDDMYIVHALMDISIGIVL